MTAEPVYSKIIKTVINIDGKLIAKDRIYLGGIGREVISLSHWFTHFRFTVVVTFGKEVGILNLKVVLNLLF